MVAAGKKKSLSMRPSVGEGCVVTGQVFEALLDDLKA